MANKFENITELLRNQSHYLNNLCSVRGGDVYIFYLKDYFFRVHYKDRGIGSIEVYNTGEWDEILEGQEYHGDLNDNLCPFDQIPFDIKEFEAKWMKTVNLLEQIKSNPNDVLCLPSYEPSFYTCYIPHVGFHFLDKNRTTSTILPYLGYFDDQTGLDYRNYTGMLIFVFKIVLKDEEIPIRPFLDEELDRKKDLIQKIAQLKIKGIHFSANRAFSCMLSKSKRFTLILSADESFYFLTENLIDKTICLERIPTRYGILTLHIILKNIPYIKEQANSPWIEFIIPENLSKLESQNPDLEIQFGKFIDSYGKRSDNQIYHSYGTYPIKFSDYAYYLDSCDWFLKTTWKN